MHSGSLIRRLGASPTQWFEECKAEWGKDGFKTGEYLNRLLFERERAKNPQDFERAMVAFAIATLLESNCYLYPRRLELDEITIDHVTPPSRGGTDAIENLKVACSTCSSIKGSRLVSDCEASEFIPDEPLVKVNGAGKREKLRQANQRLYRARIVVNSNTLQAVIERMIEAVKSE